MYKILIADDEGIVRDSLKFIIEKNFAGECEILMARNGRGAIEEVENSRPDILFLDIQMPGINGLKVLEEIHAMNAKVKTVILTAYDNFDYAKEAIRLGAVDYMMKPISKKLIVDRLNSLIAEIDKERNRRKEDLLIQEKMATVIPIIENGFVLSLILNREYEDHSEHYRELLGIGEQQGIIFVLEWGDSEKGGEMENPVGSGIRGYRHFEKMSEIVKVYFHAFVSTTLGDRLVFVIPIETDNLTYEERVQMIERARNMCDALEQEVDAEFRTGIGSVRTWDSIYESYQDAVRALRIGMRSVTHTDDLSAGSGLEMQRQKMEQMLLRTVRSGGEYETRREAGVYFNWVWSQDSSISQKKLQLIEMLFFMQRELENSGYSFEGIQKDLSGLLETDEEMQLLNYFVEACTQISAHILTDHSQADTVVSNSVEYIRKNYKKNITQEEVAAQVGISPYYFSKLFKEEMDISYTEYLTDLRIEQAKKMLENPVYSIKEVCVESGYTNPNYFSRIFKKVTGITPTEYREAAMPGGKGIEIFD